MSELQKHLNAVQKEYERVCTELTNCKKEIKELKSDKKPQEIYAAVERTRQMSLYTMTDIEQRAANAFWLQHEATCQARKNGRREYALISCDIGTSLFVRCPICGQEKDITDYNIW